MKLIAYTKTRIKVRGFADGGQAGGRQQGGAMNSNENNTEIMFVLIYPGQSSL